MRSLLERKGNDTATRGHGDAETSDSAGSQQELEFAAGRMLPFDLVNGKS